MEIYQCPINTVAMSTIHEHAMWNTSEVCAVAGTRSSKEKRDVG
jgi:hypothetical protein